MTKKADVVRKHVVVITGFVVVVLTARQSLCRKSLDLLHTVSLTYFKDTELL